MPCYVNNLFSSSDTERYSFVQVGTLSEGILKLQDVNYDDRNTFTCLMEIGNASNTTTQTKDFRLRVRGEFMLCTNSSLFAIKQDFQSSN